MSNHSTRSRKPCSKCGSLDTKHKDDDMKELSHKAAHVGLHQVHGAMSGHPVGLMLVGGMWAATKLVHTFANPWSCKKCGHSFS
jgi:ribosomal protein S27AE